MPRTKIDTSEQLSGNEEKDLEVMKEELVKDAIQKLETPPVPVVIDNVPKRYIASIYVEREPNAKDIFAGSYVYWDSTNTITFEALVPHYSTDLEIKSESDILITKEGRSSIVSRWETPKDWIKNLPFANLGVYICKSVEELYETE